MRAAIFRGGDIVVDTLPEPRPMSGQVLVKTLACGICGSDLHAAKHSHRMVEVSRRIPGRIPMDLDRDVVMGHEFCCELIDYGPKTDKKLKPGTGLRHAGDAGGRWAEGHGLFQHLCRRLCRADAAGRRR
jgi:threonine dehydrogenase-like Zn-dependent dehydrogenase